MPTQIKYGNPEWIRFKERKTFRYKTFIYDFTKVWEGRTEVSAKNSIPKYEIEIECHDLNQDSSYLSKSFLLKAQDLLLPVPKPQPHPMATFFVPNNPLPPQRPKPSIKLQPEVEPYIPEPFLPKPEITADFYEPQPVIIQEPSKPEVKVQEPTESKAQESKQTTEQTSGWVKMKRSMSGRSILALSRI